VDDHSKTDIRISEDVNLNYTLVRVRDDITWNQAGARNLGVKYAKSERIILTDLDLLFPENLFARLVDFYPPNNSIFKFHTFSGMVRTEPHFNVFFLTRKVFMRTNGVDEEFSGRYGYEDVFFYFLNKALGVRFYLFRHHNIVHREHRENEKTQHNPLTRNMDYNEALFERKMEVIEASDNPLDARSNLYLNFEWDVLQEHKMK
jgi:glycosyltransferase involved in cell wall biosynthesis